MGASNQGEVYGWAVEVRHDVQGFNKRYRVSAQDYAGAVGAAMLEVHDQGYEPSGFAVVALRRGRPGAMIEVQS